MVHILDHNCTLEGVCACVCVCVCVEWLDYPEDTHSVIRQTRKRMKDYCHIQFIIKELGSSSGGRITPSASGEVQTHPYLARDS